METSEESGVAHIKKEYIKPVEHSSSSNTTDTCKNNSGTQEPAYKKLKTSGKNQNRPKLVREDKGRKLCRSYWAILPGETPSDDTCAYPECQFSHDIQAYMDNKPEDIFDTCSNYDTYGYCPYGVTCRFGSKHIEGCGSNRDEKQYKEFIENPPVTNLLKNEIRTSLRKKKYDFTKANEASKLNKKNLTSTVNGKSLVADSSDTPHVNISETVDLKGDASDCDVPLKKKIEWKNKLYLAPLTTLGNLPFRRICKKLGADVTCSEMALATNLLQGSPSEWALVKRHRSEDIFGVQVCGSNVEQMVRCAQLLDEQIHMDFLDINMGCPIDFIYRQGGGSALMRRSSALGRMVRGMNEVISCPLTLKMRTGVYRNSNVARSIIEEAKLWDVNLITVHGRSKEQRYLRLADWDYIDECAKMASPRPLFGNGDVLTYEDYNKHLNNSSVSGIMIGRGALLKPWIFTEIKEQRTWDISSTERFDILKEFVNYGLEHWGSDSEGVEKTRRFLLEWLSFLHRYIPVGLLERPPQMINQRPTPYFGRNDLETLMASNKVNDWVNISEKLLGRVPDNFHFLPKHRANSWV